MSILTRVFGGVTWHVHTALASLLASDATGVGIGLFGTSALCIRLNNFATKYIGHLQVTKAATGVQNFLVILPANLVEGQIAGRYTVHMMTTDPTLDPPQVWHGSLTGYYHAASSASPQLVASDIGTKGNGTLGSNFSGSAFNLTINQADSSSRKWLINYDYVLAPTAFA